MSIDYEPHTMLGWWVEDDYDERINEAWDSEFECLDDIAGKVKAVTGQGVWSDSLVVQVNSICCDEGWFVGVPLTFGAAMPLSEFGHLDELAGLAEEVWRAIYHADPPSEPCVMSFVETY